MNFVSTRLQRRADGIFSQITDEQGVKLAVSVEHSYEQPDGSFWPKILNGTYTCRRRMSPRFGFYVFWIDIPDHDLIEMHPGNFSTCSEGCVCVGEAIAMDGSIEMVTKSDITFKKLMELQEGVDEFEWTFQG